MPGTTPKEIYTHELNALETLQARARHRERIYGYVKLALLVAGLALATFLVRQPAGIAVLVLIFIAFLYFVVLQEKALQSIRLRERALAFYQRGLARLDGSWHGTKETGEEYLHAEHPYARDLDIFGAGSLFQFLSNARTRAGEQLLASWLQQAATPAVITSRQDAVRELAARLNFREELFAVGSAVRSETNTDALIAWGKSSRTFSSTATRLLTTGLAVLWIASLVMWAYTGQPLLVLLTSVLNFAYSHRLHTRAESAAENIERAASDLRALGKLLKIVEREQFSSARLRELKALLVTSGVRPSSAVLQLARIAELIQSRHSLFMRPLDLVTFWSAQLLFVGERWQRRYGSHIREWISIAAEIEALASLASFAFEHSSYAFPSVESGRAIFCAEEMGHPLLGEGAVENDVQFSEQQALIILSGPNMAGKSTFIRSIGVNAVLAQCGAPVRAASLRMSPVQVAASICVLDSLSGGVSRFYAEIQRLKLIDDLTGSGTPVLFLLDELLSGTNSHDRFAGTEFVLRTFVERGSVGIVSTHDLSLTGIADALAGRAINAHFQDHVEAGKLFFDYKLKPGVVKTSNALKLMRAVGFGVPESSELPPVE